MANWPKQHNNIADERSDQSRKQPMTAPIDPLTPIATTLSQLMPVFADLADRAESTLAFARKHGVSHDAKSLALIDVMDRTTAMLEGVQRSINDAVPRLRAALDELMRMHEGS